jgi:hypothetical protein
VDEINGWQIKDYLHGKKKYITPKFHVHNNQKENNSMKNLGCYINCLLSYLIITKTKVVKIQKILFNGILVVLLYFLFFFIFTQILNYSLVNLIKIKKNLLSKYKKKSLDVNFKSFVFKGIFLLHSTFKMKKVYSFLINLIIINATCDKIQMPSIVSLVSLGVKGKDIIMGYL